MATRTSFQDRYNNITTGRFKDNSSGDIGADDVRDLVEQIQDTFVQNQVFITAGTAPTYTLDLTPNLSDTTNSALLVKFHAASAGSATIDIDGAGAISIFAGGVALDGSAINTSLVYLLIKNETNYDIIGSASADPSIQNKGNMTGTDNIIINATTDVVQLTLTGNLTLSAITGFKEGKEILFKVGTNSGADFPYQITWPTTVKFNDGIAPVLKNNTTGKFDLIRIIGIDGSNNAQIDTVIYG